MALKGDFLGFTFNGHHSSEFGLVRTSDGSRFNENLLPTMSDKTVQVPGGDGTYFFGTYFTQRQFTISVSTVDLDEKGYRDLRNWLNAKEICPLFFDEEPYKTYYVKCEGTPTFKFLCFDEDEQYEEDGTIKYRKVRVYKGEGSIQFISYYPYARCLNDQKYGDYWAEKEKSNSDSSFYYINDNFEIISHIFQYSRVSLPKESNLDQYYIYNEKTQQYTKATEYKDGEIYYKKGKYTDYHQWWDASGLLDEELDDMEATGENYDILLHNPGDLPTNYRAYYNFNDGTLQYCAVNNVKLTLSGIEKIGSDNGFIIDSRKHLIEGITFDIIDGIISNIALSGNLYNKYISSGSFEKIPICDAEADKDDKVYFYSSGIAPFKFEYDYLYL